MKIQGLTKKINQTLNNKDNTINYLEEEQKKYQQLGQEVNQFLTKYSVKSFAQLSNGIQGLLSDRSKYKNQCEQAQIEITNKDDRITQLYKLFQGTATIFQKQHNYVDQLKENLEKEKQNKGISQEQEEHLRADIERLGNEKNELTERIEELRVKEELLKELRDKELADLKKEKNELTDNYNKLRDDILYIVIPDQIKGYAYPDQDIITATKDLSEELVTRTTERDARPNITSDQWNNDYSKRPTQQQLTAIQQELTYLKKKTPSWKGFYTWLIEDSGLKEAGNNTLDSVFTKAPSKYSLLEKSISWMLFWKSLENTVADKPDFRQWSWSFKPSDYGKNNWSRTFTRFGTGTWSGTGAWSGNWVGSKFKVRNDHDSGTGTETPLPNFELDKNLSDIFNNQQGVIAFVSSAEITQFNQIFNDWKQFIKN